MIPEPLQAALRERYRIERELGHGGMATVYLAQDLKHHRSVAIKVLDPDLSASLGAERFRQEIEFAARLHHPHILTLLDSGAAGNLLYYVMPFVEGESLRARLDRERQLGVDDALRLTGEVARALDYAHRQGVVHRDIKPENILLADGQAMVADFGIARAIREAGGEGLTRSGATLGTPPYMSPEQMAGRPDVDGRSDLYSLACVLYEMLAGQPPFTGSAESIAHQHLSVTPRPVTELRPRVSSALAAVLAQALAKTPADRFATGAQFAEALRPEASAPSAAGTGVVATPAAASRAPTPGRRGLWISVIAALLVGVLVLVLARGGMVELLGSRSPTPATPRQWVWLAAFDGPPADPSLAPAARELVGAALDQSQALATVPVEQIRIALRNAGRPDSTRVDGVLARELAYRSSIRAVVEGRIGRIGQGYSIVLRATDSEDGHLIRSADATAADDRALIPVLGRLARDLREGLGERPGALRATPALSDAATPSFEAFKLYTRGRALINDFENDAALPLLYQAVKLDPDFAAAWSGIGTALNNLGKPDSSLAALREALRHPDRLSEVRRLSIEAQMASARGDTRTVLDTYDAILKLNPSPIEAAVALHNQAGLLVGLGRYEQALELFRRSAAAWPIEPPQLSYMSIDDALMGMGRIGEAQANMAHLKGWRASMVTFEVLLAERAWSRVESLTVSQEADPAQRLDLRMALGTGHASALAARGRLQAASQLLERNVGIAVAERDTLSAAMGWWNGAWLAALTGHGLPALPAIVVASKTGLAVRVLDAAMRGDSTTARRLLPRLEFPGPPELRAVFAAQVHGWLDWHGGRWTRVVEGLRESARGGHRGGIPPLEAMRMPARWLMADAFERMGQADSAAAYLGLMLEPPSWTTPTLLVRGFSDPFVRQRLVLLDARLGRMDEARRQWQLLSETCTQPEPEMVAMLDETRAALQAAEAMRSGSAK